MTKIDLYMIRHGETIFNTMDKLQGWADSPLTQNGIKLAQETGDKLADTAFDFAFSSDSKRAIDTAKIIIERNHSLEVTVPTELPNFREAFFGSFEGLDNNSVWTEVTAPYGFHNQTEMLEHVSPFIVRDRMHAQDPLKRAETGEEFWQRITNGFNQLRSMMPDQSSAMLIAHGTLIRAIAITYGGNAVDAIHNFPKNGGITHLELTDDTINILSYNQ